MRGPDEASAADVVAASFDGVAITDGTTVVDANEAFAEAYGYADADAVVGESWHAWFPADERRRLEREALDRVRTARAWRGTATGRRPDGSTFRQELSLRRTDGERVVWVVRADRSNPTRPFARYETLIDTIADGVYTLDENLRFSFVNDAICEMFGRSADDLIGLPATELLGEEERATADEIRDRVVAGDGRLGTIQGTVTDEAGETVHLEAHYCLSPPADDEFRGSVGVIRDVTDRVERERRLERQRDELATFERINRLVFDITRDLVETPSRDAVERTVCDRLADSDLYRFAWVGERAFDGSDVVVRTSAGDEDVDRAIRTDAVSVADPSASDSLPHDAGSVAAVPLSHDGVVYGVLVVYASRPNAFSDREQTGFAVLGETVGFVVDALRNRTLLLADSVVELVFRLPDADHPLLDASESTDARLELEGYHVTDGDAWTAYFSVERAAADRVGAHVDAATPASVRVIDARPGASVLELTAEDVSLFGTVSEAGAKLVACAIEDGTARITVEVPAVADVRPTVEAVRTACPAAELVAQRERDRPVADTDPQLDVLTDLTDRQRQVLEVAYHAGYFDWPRGSTAEEVADAVDITSSTLHAHLRKAESRLLSAFLDE